MHFLGEPPKPGERTEVAAEHITVLGNLTHPSRQDHEKLIEILDNLTHTHPIVTGDGVKQYGPAGEYKALSLNDGTGSLTELHKLLHDEAVEQGYITTHPQYARDNFSPHITLTNDETTVTSIEVTHLTLVESVLDSDNKFLYSTTLHTQPIKLPN